MKEITLQTIEGLSGQLSGTPPLTKDRYFGDDYIHLVLTVPTPSRFSSSSRQGIQNE